jgi:deoxyribodipyrimidine photolyase-related protein
VEVDMSPRNLVLVLGDVLDPRSPAFDGFDGRRDLVWVAELPGEAAQVWSHKARVALFPSAMRHFAAGLEEAAVPLRYLRLGGNRTGALPRP